MNYLISEVPYFQTPNEIFETKLTVNEKIIYIYLCRCANNGKVAFPSYQTIADKCSISKSTAIRSIKVLVNEGYVIKQYRIKEDGENYSNLYNVSYNIGSVTETPPSITQTPPSVIETPNKELPINKNIEKNNSLHHSDRMTSVFLNLLNKYSIKTFGKGIRKHDPNKYYETDYLECLEYEEDFYEFLEENITKYEWCNMDYLTTIQERLK